MCVGIYIWSTVLCCVVYGRLIPVTTRFSSKSSGLGSGKSLFQIPDSTHTVVVRAQKQFFCEKFFVNWLKSCFVPIPIYKLKIFNFLKFIATKEGKINSPFPWFLLFCDFFENYVNVASKRKFFFAILKVTDKNMRIRSRIWIRYS